MSARRKGLLIVFEGIDGGGKTTQARYLVQNLRRYGHPVVASREPGGTAGGRILRTHLLDPPQGGWSPWTKVALFLAARHEHVQRVIRPALEAGKIVVLDRFTHSTLAYQGAGDKVRRENLYPIAEAAADGVVPDLVLLLDLSAEAGLKRIARRTEEAGETEVPVSRSNAWLERVAKGYRALAKEATESGATAAKAERFVTIKANRAYEAVAADVWHEVVTLLREHGRIREADDEKGAKA